MQEETIFRIKWLKKVGQQEQVFYYQWPPFLAQEKWTTNEVVEAVTSVVETESSVVAVFSGSGTEDDTSKVVEVAVSVMAVSMLTSGVSVVDADECTL